MNYKFHLEDWLPRFPLEADSFGSQAEHHYCADNITSPFHICNNLLLRDEFEDQFDWGRAVPVDVFVMSHGEPENRFATKIGGLPYRTPNAPWPATPSGQPLAFFGQLNFTDSRDIVGDLPGDLLLVFANKSHDLYQPIHLEWQHLEAKNLVQPDQVPDGGMTVPPCFGNICRVMSYPEAITLWRGQCPKIGGKEVWNAHMIAEFQATQIGRAPCFIQESVAVTWATAVHNHISPTSI